MAERSTLSGALGHGQARDYTWTYVAEIATVLSVILSFRLVATIAGPEGFAEYQLGRGAVAVLQLGLLMGFGVALPRYVAASDAREDRQPGGYFTVASLAAGCLLLVFVPIGFLLRGQLAHLFFGDPRRAAAMGAVLVLVVGTVAHGVVYGYLRGLFRIGRANALTIVGLGILPLVAVLVAGDVGRMFLILGLARLLSSVVFLVGLPISWVDDLRSHAAEIVPFGLRRVPGEIALSVFMVVPGALAAQLVGFSQAGLVGLGASVVGLFSSLFAPIGLVVLPRASRALRLGAGDQLRAWAWRLMVVTAALAVLGTLTLLAFLDFALRIYLGPDFGSAGAVIRPFLLGTVPFSVYVVGRGLIDAYYDAAINSRNIVAALAVASLATLGLSLAISGASAVAYGFVAGAWFLGIRTAFALRAGFGIRVGVSIPGDDQPLPPLAG